MFKDRKGKFGIGRVEEFKIVFDKSVLVNCDTNEVDERDDCAVHFKDMEEGIVKLNQTDLKEFKKVKNKIKMLKSLK